MNKKILFITALHGNEGFAVDLIKKIEEKYDKEKFNFDWVIGNPNAHKQNVRFTDTDLNRIAPGNINSENYEEKRAAELIELSKNYSLVVDIHGTNANSGIFTLVSNPTIENLIVATSLPVKNIVIWASQSSKTSGPVTQFLNCPAVEIECGPKSSPEIQSELKNIISKILENRQPKLEEIISNVEGKNFFQVYGSIEETDTSNMKEFKETEVHGEKFYPLLVNSYKQGSVRKMKKVNFFDLFMY